MYVYTRKSIFLFVSLNTVFCKLRKKVLKIRWTACIKILVLCMTSSQNLINSHFGNRWNSQRILRKRPLKTEPTFLIYKHTCYSNQLYKSMWSFTVFKILKALVKSMFAVLSLNLTTKFYLIFLHIVIYVQKSQPHRLF